MSLNPEPAAPEERAELDLPPKSYAEAAEEALEPTSHVNSTDGTVEETTRRLRNKIDDVKSNGIRIPDTTETGSLEGVGLDASPKSPTMKGHKRKSSRSSMGSPGRKHGDNGVLEKHVNGDGETLTSVKPEKALVKENRIDRPKRRNSELKSGRQAGAGWARSK